MINQLRGDLYAIRHSGPVLLCLAVSVVAAALYTVLQHSLAAGDLGPEAASGVQVLSDALMVSLMGPLLFGAMVVQAFETRSVHNSLLASGRGAFVGAKTLLTAAAVTALSLPYGIAVLIGLATEEEFAPAIPTAFSQLLAAGGGIDGGRAGEVLAITVTMAVLTTAKLSVIARTSPMRAASTSPPVASSCEKAVGIAGANSSPVASPIMAAIP